jgi:hypothetical protein
LAAEGDHTDTAMGSQGGAQWQIGNEVEFKTAGGEEVSGQVYAFTPDSGMLLIKEPGAHNGVANLRWLKTSYVAEVLKNGAPAVPFDTQLPELDIAKCQKREAKALQQAEKEASRIGVGVSKTSQVTAASQTFGAWDGSLHRSSRCMHPSC